ncbi:hypothetical protein BFP72_01065 [Reichenbachiella sp. 5M10]|uniref:hypothetical protein n=1 Tax=Reichenbachiella sp. 5M10 TaxID=1889772 RepID=UPI000C15FA32|nr:hypothetical protein [Reichenbachiella sp. 5M10]PIB34114.1 hypothetical protein BFP72_01065 [Reichenbachiella sp. 5M10]
MKKNPWAIVLIAVCMAACCRTKEEKNPLIGTWELQSGTLIKGTDTIVTDYTQNLRFIKIINKTHFAFLKHDLNQGKDSTAAFTAGGGTYELIGDQYTEHLEFLNYREWEGNDFEFVMKVTGDTLIQEGIEKIESLGVEQYNIERYIRTTK